MTCRCYDLERLCFWHELTWRERLGYLVTRLVVAWIIAEGSHE